MVNVQKVNIVKQAVGTNNFVDLQEVVNKYGEQVAVIVVDYQNDFAKPGAPMYVPGGETLGPRINEVVNAVKKAGGIIITMQDWHTEDLENFPRAGETPFTIRENGEFVWPKHCLKETPGANYYPTFDTAPVDYRILKDGKKEVYTGFQGHEATGGVTLAELLRNTKIKAVIVLALAIDYCVKATALDAITEGFDTYFDLQGSAAVNVAPDDEINAIQAMVDAGAKVIEPQA